MTIVIIHCYFIAVVSSFAQTNIPNIPTPAKAFANKFQPFANKMVFSIRAPQFAFKKLCLSAAGKDSSHA